MNCLIVIAHPNPGSFENTKLLKTIQMNYKTKGFTVITVDLYRDGYNPSTFVGDMSNLRNDAFSKSYRHLIKTSNHIVIISGSRWLSLDHLMEAFIDYVFTKGFAYDDVRGLLGERKITAIVTSNKPKVFRLKTLDILRIRLRWMVLPTMFKWNNINVLQIWNVNQLEGKAARNSLQKIVNNFRKISS